MNDLDKNISDWVLEQYALGELDKSKMDEISNLIKESAELKARLERIEKSNREILEAHPPRVVAAAINQRLEAQKAESEKRGFAFNWSMAAVPLSLLLVLFAGIFMYERGIVGPYSGERIVTANGEVIYTKGLEPQIHVYRASGNDSERLEADTIVKEGQKLQLAYIAAGMTYGVIVSVDGRGAITRHLPESGDGAALLERDGEKLLKFAYQLDDAPGFERFFFVGSEKPFKVETVQKAVEELAQDTSKVQTELLNLPDGLKQTCIKLNK